MSFRTVNKTRPTFLSSSFLSYLLLFVMGVSILSIGFYSFLGHQLRNQYDKSYLDATASAGEQLNSQLNRLTNSIVELTSSKWVTEYLYRDSSALNYDSLDILEIKEQTDELTRLQVLSGILDDVVLVFPERDVVLSSKGRERIAPYFQNYVSLETMGDPDEFLSENSVWKWQRVPNAVVYGQQKDLLVCRSSLPLYRRNFYGAVLLYVDTEKIAAQNRLSGLLQGSDIMLMDKQGQVLLGNTDASNLAYIQDMILRGEQLSCGTGLKDYEQICITQIDYNGWYYIALIPQSYTLRVLQLMDWISLAIVIFMLALGALSAYLMACRSIKPIQHLHSVLNEHSRQPVWYGYADMEASLRSLIRSVEEGQKDLSRYRPLAQSSLLNSLFTGSATIKGIDPLLLASVGLNITSGYLTVFVLRGEEQAASAITQSLKQFQCSLWHCQQGAKLHCWLMRTEADISDDLPQWLDAHNELQLGVSQTRTAVDVQMAEMYAQAAAALQKSRTTEDMSKIHDHMEMRIPDTTPFIDALKVGDMKQLESLLEEFEQTQMSLSERHYQAYLLASAMIRHASYAQLGIDYGIEQMTLMQQETEILTFLKRIGRDICEKTYHSEFHEDEFIRSINAYMDQHLTDSSLSVSTIAQAMNRSDSYVSRSYKARTGVNLSWEISKRRVMLAVQELERGASISAAAKFAGFDSELTFRRTFKKIMALNPSEYIKRL